MDYKQKAIKTQQDLMDWYNSADKGRCTSPAHDFPNMLVVPAGTSHTHTCPHCGNKITVRGAITW